MFDWLVNIFTIIISFFSKLFGFSSVPNEIIVTPDTTSEQQSVTETPPVAPVDPVVVAPNQDAL